MSLYCNAQNITYNELIKLDWSDHPYSIAELLIEKGFKFGGRQIIQGELLRPEESIRETHYQLSYTNVSEHNIMAAYVCVDELNRGNISDQYPVVKFRFMQPSKARYENLSNEIKSACGDPEMGFYFC